MVHFVRLKNNPTHASKLKYASIGAVGLLVMGVALVSMWRNTWSAEESVTLFDHDSIDVFPNRTAPKAGDLSVKFFVLISPGVLIENVTSDKRIPYRLIESMEGRIAGVLIRYKWRLLNDQAPGRFDSEKVALPLARQFNATKAETSEWAPNLKVKRTRVIALGGYSVLVARSFMALVGVTEGVELMLVDPWSSLYFKASPEDINAEKSAIVVFKSTSVASVEQTEGRIIINVNINDSINAEESHRNAIQLWSDSYINDKRIIIKRVDQDRRCNTQKPRYCQKMLGRYFKWPSDPNQHPSGNYVIA